MLVERSSPLATEVEIIVDGIGYFKESFGRSATGGQPIAKQSATASTAM